ncbi:hypothetical protein MBLNU457_3144t1 [Dothideomycetes sp. NU457]
MGLIKGGFLRFAQTFLYLLCFCCAGLILGIYSYFLAVLADRDLPIAGWKRAVEALSGAACIYTMFAVVLTCCLAGITFFSFLGLVLDLLFMGAFIAMAVMTRNGANSCTGVVTTPIGTGLAYNDAAGANLGLACRLNSAALAVAIAGSVLFLITALMQVVLVRHHKKEKRYGPSPRNNYTSGFGRKNKNKDVEKDAEIVAPVAAAPVVAHHHHDTVRPSGDTAYTGSTVGNGAALVKDTDPAPGAIHPAVPSQGPHGTYYTQPLSHGDNPYGMPSSLPTNAHAGQNF